MKVARKLWTWALAVVATFALVLGLSTVAYAAAGEVPAHEKSATDNGDGTYTLELSVTGDADDETQEAGKVNILVIYDTSSSMTSNAQGSNYTRADQAEDVVHDFLTNLAKYQNNAKDNINVALVTFARYTDQHNEGQTWTTDVTALANRFDDGGTDRQTNMSYSGNQSNGTNWESALIKADNLLASAPGGTSVPTFVIMMTDGAPTASGNGNNAINPSGATIAQLRNFYDAATEYAYAVAQACKATGGTFYGIYAYGDEGDLMDDLMYFSENNQHRGGNIDNVVAATQDAPNFFRAADTAALDAAITEIFNEVVNALGISSVSISDGTTNQVATSTGVSELLEIDESSYQYWLSIPVVNNQFTRKMNVIEGGVSRVEEVTYTVTDNGDGTCTVNWTEAGSPKSVTVDGSVSSGNFKYEWTESNDLYKYNPPAAKLTNGSVDWNLSSVGTLLDGVTYSVTFKVYPSQETLDDVADIKNNPGENGAWKDLDPAVQQYIDVNGNLKTNTTATLTYSDTRLTDPGPKTTTFTNPDPVKNSAIEELAVTKDWSNLLEDDWKKPDSVTLNVTRDDDPHYSVTLNDDNSWTDTVFISIGIMGADGKPLDGSEGHDFTFTEPEIQGESFKWEIDAPTVHPMLINNVVTMLVKADADHPVPDGATTYEFNDATYYVDEAATALTATNERRSSLNITKVVDGDDAPEDAIFPFTLHVNDPLAPATAPSEEDDPGHDSDYWIWISVRDKDGNRITEGVEGATHDGGGWWYAPNDTDVTIPVKAGYSIRINNVPVGTTYTITEGELPEGFIFESSALSFVDGDEDAEWAFEGGQTSSGSIDTTNAVFLVTFTNKYELVDVNVDKVWDDNSNQDGIRPETLELTLNAPEGVDVPNPTITPSEDGNTWTYVWKGLPRFDSAGEEITYTVTEENVPASYTCETTTVNDGGTITNKHTPEVTTISVEKIWEGPVATATITLKAGDEVVGTITLPNEGKNTYTWENLPKKADGEDIVYTVSEDPIANYATTGPTGTGTANDPFTFTNKNTETVTVTATKVWDDSNNIGGIRPKELELTVNGLPTGTTAPTPEITKSEDGNTWTYTWTGLPKYASDGTALTYTVSEDAVPSGYTKSPTDPVSSGGTITNTYSPKTTTAEIKAGKKLDVPQGLDGTDVTGKYTLTLEANEGVPMPQGATTADGKQTVSIQNKDGNGTMDTFGEITYTTPGVYQYKVSESGTVSGVTNGTDSYTVLVTVADNGSGELVATVKIGEEESNEVLFTNTYSASSTSASFEVIKVLEGAELAAGAYSFELKEGDKVLQTKTNGADGSVKFDAIAYTAPGEFTYTISEVAGDKDYIEYDDHSVTVKVTVKDNGEGSLVADVTYTGGETFTNTYTATGEVEFSVAKEYNRAFEGGEFSFELKEGDEVLQTKSNDADGSVKFDAIEYTLDDLKETTTVETTVSYKEVVDEETGTTTYVNVDDETDVLDELPDGAVLNDETGNYDVTTEAEETTYKDEAEFTYTISEVAGDKDYIEYDTHEVTVTVTVKDNGEGKLEATASFDGDTEFINTYSASGSITLEGVKKLEGRELQEGQFTFQLLDKDNNVLGTATNGADGTFKFEGLDALTFDETDDGAELTFYIAEVNDNKTGYTYDTHKCKVTVTVTDNGNGTMSATAEYDDGDTAVFNNKFAPLPVSIDPPVKKVVEGNPQTPATFTFQMKALTDGAPMPDGSADGIKTVQITGTGSYEFGDIVYTAPGKWEYEISELNGGVENYTYDSTKYTITVTVSEDADGDGYLDKDVVITGGNGEIVFTNVYKPPVPKTGDATPQAGMLALAAAVVTGIAAFGARRRED